MESISLTYYINEKNRLKFINPFIFFLSIFLLSSAITSNAQENVFSASIIAGPIFSQVRGDDLAGYHKIGYSGGIGISYRLVNRWETHLELLYSHAGSRSSIFFPKDRFIDLNLAQIPLYFSYLTWWDNGLAKFQFDGGINISRILDINVDYNKIEPHLSEVQKNDLSLLLGFGLWLNQHHGIFGRYVRSFTPFLEIPNEAIPLKLFYLSLQYHYRF